MEGMETETYFYDTKNTTVSYFNWTNHSDGVSLEATTFENTIVEDNVPAVVYCGEGWANFWNFLRPFNIPARAIVCIVGIITNILNILVFTRKPMRNPTNTILTALCISDLLCLVRLSENWMVALLKPGITIHGDPGWKKTYTMALHNFTSEILVNLFHSWSVYLTITICFWRLFGVSQPLKSIRWCTTKGAKGAVFISILIGLILMIPMYCYAYINVTTHNDQGVMLKNPEYFWTMRVGWAWHLYLWTHIIFIKVAPCSILTIATVILILYLVKAQKNRNILMERGKSDGKSSDISPHEKSEESPQIQKRKLEFDRITRMLVTVVIVFLVTEFPFGLINLFNSFLGHEFLLQCKNPVLSFLSLGEFISSATNFFVYFFMSTNFRLNFYKLFKSDGKSKQSTDFKSRDYYSRTTTTSASTTTIDSHV